MATRSAIPCSSLGCGALATLRCEGCRAPYCGRGADIAHRVPCRYNPRCAEATAAAAAYGSWRSGDSFSDPYGWGWGSEDSDAAIVAADAADLFARIAASVDATSVGDDAGPAHVGAALPKNVAFLYRDAVRAAVRLFTLAQQMDDCAIASALEKKLTYDALAGYSSDPAKTALMPLGPRAKQLSSARMKEARDAWLATSSQPSDKTIVTAVVDFVHYASALSAVDRPAFARFVRLVEALRRSTNITTLKTTTIMNGITSANNLCNQLSNGTSMRTINPAACPTLPMCARNGATAQRTPGGPAKRG